MKKTFALLALLIILTGCNKKIVPIQEKQNDCISDNCVIENCINKNVTSCKTAGDESGNAEDKANKLNDNYPTYHCSWALNNTSNESVIHCYKK